MQSAAFRHAAKAAPSLRSDGARVRVRVSVGRVRVRVRARVRVRDEIRAGVRG